MCLMKGPNFKCLLHNPLYGGAIGTKKLLNPNWQGSFPKATTVASNVVVVQRNLTTTVHQWCFWVTYPRSIQFNVNHPHWFHSTKEMIHLKDWLKIIICSRIKSWTRITVPKMICSWTLQMHLKSLFIRKAHICVYKLLFHAWFLWIC